MPKTAGLPPKKDVALALLEQSTIFVHLDPRKDEVRVPQWFRKQPQLVLQIGLNMPVPIPDLNLDEEGLSCTLSFNRSPHFCKVPWSAVYALVGENGRGMVWPDDVPPEVPAKAQAAAKPEEKRAHLQAVAEGARKPQANGKAGAKTAKPDSAKPDDAKADGKKRKRTRRVAAAQTEPAATPTPRLAPQAQALPQAQPARAATLEDDGGAASPKPDTKKKRELPPYLRVVK